MLTVVTDIPVDGLQNGPVPVLVRKGIATQAVAVSVDTTCSSSAR